MEPIAPRTDLAYRAAKRLLDLLVASIALVLLSPLFVVVAVAIKLTSPGPILFRGIVHGRNGKPFTYYKFRSMAAGGDTSQHREFIRAYVADGKGQQDAKTGEEVFKLTNDPRVTPFGRFIRRFSIDEFPQMLNVLKGDMSLVGPRPPVPYEYELYDQRKKLRLLVKPGITGLNQIRARGQSSFEQMYQDDLDYIRNQSLWLDLAILFKTPWVMLFRAGKT